MKRLLKNFYADETGAITVDWVVLTAAIIGMVIAIFAFFNGPTSNIATAIGNAIGAMTVGG
ncbi:MULTISPECIES: Flp family type IVb pilin [Halocynthiibacter]|uniref:Pilus assembly protein n=1 Tax=Halocynthiibacter halioticoli TaxID=2986804 RepID=A0AAE3LS78_9RHOB|nr:MULTISPECIES: hypothetical protein [Halocynthiibacter]MCV6825269.1 hypothetical protein [Halocynthiibacter halioticoli]MCW4058270.1 hypothetical protein [Halocynthiibacter sp. SDUM655004]MDE0588709.1 hypothetical protein [Halocynthiibacter sp. C4]